MLRVSIHCEEKKILFMMEGETVMFEGVKSRSLSRVISAIQTLRSVRKGCQAFLASVVDISRVTPSLSDIKIVRGISICVFREFTPNTTRAKG